MKLVVLGKEPLDELETWVGDLFANVPNKDLPQKRWDDVPLYSSEELMKEIFAKPVMDQRYLEISFPYQDEEEMYETQPNRYISHLIGHEGPGSILSYIKAKGWANALSSGPSRICPGSSLFAINIKLTEEGLKVYHDVVKVVFQYISLIKEAPPQEWIVEEMMGLAEVDFKFQEQSPASDFTSSMSSVMQKPYPREWLLSGSDLIRRFDGEAISAALKHIRADNFRLSLVSQQYPGDWDKKEKWYGTEYKTQPIDREFAALLKKAEESSASERLPDLHLPHRNEFIPSNLNVEKKDDVEPTQAPKLIRNDELVRTWWKKDDRFWVPRGNIFITLRNPVGAATAANHVKSSLFCSFVKDALVEYSYDAELAGLEYDLKGYNVGLGVDISGYNDKMAVLLEKVLVSMRDLEVKPDRFKIMKERMMRGFRNHDFQQPFRQIGDYTLWLGSDKGWVNDLYLAELPHITAEDVANFYPQLLRHVHIEILCHGNIYKETALRITDLVETTLKPRALPPTQWQITRNLLLPPGHDCTYRRTLGDPANVNHCIEYYVFVGNNMDRILRAKLLLLAQLTDEVGFDQLRTKEQLGYIVFTGVRMQATTMGYRVIIQSERPTEYLEERINAFLASFARGLDAMPEAEFESHKKSLINKRLEKLKNLDEESAQLWGHISNEYFDFQQKERDVEHIKPLAKSDLIQFFKDYIHPTSPHRAKLSVHMIAHSSSKLIAGNMSPAEQKEKLLAMLAKYLTAMGIEANAESLSTRFEAVDILGGDLQGILEAIQQYLLQDAGVAEADAAEVLEQGEEMLATILPSLGIEIKQVPDGVDGAEALPEAPPVKETTYIENVRDYKVGLPVSAGRRAVTELSEFEDTEPKL